MSLTPDDADDSRYCNWPRCGWAGWNGAVCPTHGDRYLIQCSDTNALFRRDKWERKQKRAEGRP